MKRLTREDFDKMIIWNDDVLIEIPNLSANKVKFNDSFLEIVSSGTSTDQQATRFGIIAKMPRKHVEVETNIFNAKLEAKKGDGAWFDAFFAQEQIAKRKDKTKKEMLYEVDNILYIAVPSSAVVAIKRGEEIMGTCGNVIGEVLPEEEVSQGGIILLKPKSKYKRVKVHHASDAEVTFKENDRHKFGTTKVKKGDVVIVPKHFPIPLDKTYTSTTDLVRFQSFTIIATE